MTVLGGRQLHELSMEAVAEAAGVGKPVLYTAFRTRPNWCRRCCGANISVGWSRCWPACPTTSTEPGPTGAYAATVSAFLRVVLENPARWRLILTVPDSAPREYRDDLRRARSSILAQAEQLAKAGIALDKRLTDLDPVLLGHTMLSFAEMLGRLAVNDPETYPRERLEEFAAAAMGMLARRR